MPVLIGEGLRVNSCGKMHRPVGAWGDLLAKKISNARREVVFVAPFITLGAFTRLFDVVPKEVPFRCVTRWLPQDISAGVTDLDIWPMIRDRNVSDLLLHNRLHAKYFRVDDECYVGSANITLNALGWAPNPNLELLVRTEARHLQQFEEELMRYAFPATEDLYQYLVMHIEQMQMQPYPLPASDAPADYDALALHWVPSLRDPSMLYDAYIGDFEILTSAAREAAHKDLVQLALPLGLVKSQFQTYVGTILLQTNVVRRVDDYVKVPRRFGEMRAFLHTLECAQAPHFDAAHDWQTLMRWLLFFLPGRYSRSVARYSEIFQKTPDSGMLC